MPTVRPVSVMVLCSLAMAAIAGALGFWWMATGSRSVMFLSRRGPAEWIVYPLPASLSTRPAVVLDADFRRRFTLARAPRLAPLRWRALTQCAITVNGSRVATPGESHSNWKHVRQLDVANLLRAGPNEILVSVRNSQGPPALWLWLTADDQSVVTDTSWEVSQAGAVSQQARLASTTLDPFGTAGEYRDSENVARAIRRHDNAPPRTWPALVAALPWLALWAILASGGVAAVAILPRWLAPSVSRRTANRPRVLNLPLAALLAALVLWFVLLAHNLPNLHRSFGFDSAGHLEYIQYILDRGSLPLANEGWEMYHPPLYYLLSAGMLKTVGLSTADDAGPLIARVVSAAAGMANLVLVLTSLRLLFADQPVKQLAGFSLAVVLPMHLYMSHYATNEILCAMLTSAAVYLTLRILRPTAHPLAMHAALGVCLGAALFTKLTGVVALMAVAVVLVGRIAVDRHERKPRIVGIAVMLAVSLFVGGWHYARSWIHFGTPLATNISTGGPFAIWQDPGYRVPSSYWRFGRSLIQPDFSGLYGVFDGFNSTLWGDGLHGGATDARFHPPWNYTLLSAGYLLAILPALLIAVGAVSLIVDLVRRPKPETWLLVVLGGGIVLYVVASTLLMPFYSMPKSFYALPALVPMCSAAAHGFETLTRGRAQWMSIATVALAVWGINAYAAHWIRAGTAEHHYLLGRAFLAERKNDKALAEFQAATRIDPRLTSARFGAGTALQLSDRDQEAVKEFEEALALDHDDVDANRGMATSLFNLGRYDETIRHARRVVAQEPDEHDGYLALAAALDRQGKSGEAIHAYQQALRIRPLDADLHFKLASLYARVGRSDDALRHFDYAVRIRPDHAESRLALAHALLAQGEFGRAIVQFRAVLERRPGWPPVVNDLAWIMATCRDGRYRDGRVAVQLATSACHATGFQEPGALDTLAAAYAEAGRYDDAVRTAQQAIDAALAAHQPDIAESIRARLLQYTRRQPHREG